MKTITLDGVEYELVPFVRPEEVYENGEKVWKKTMRGYLLKPTEVTNQSLS